MKMKSKQLASLLAASMIAAVSISKATMYTEIYAYPGQSQSDSYSGSVPAGALVEWETVGIGASDATLSISGAGVSYSSHVGSSGSGWYDYARGNTPTSGTVSGSFYVQASSWDPNAFAYIAAGVFW